MGIELIGCLAGYQLDQLDVLIAVGGEVFSTQGRVMLPAIIAASKNGARTRFLEFFTVNIRNPNTRAGYGITSPSAIFLRITSHRPPHSRIGF